MDEAGSCVPAFALPDRAKIGQGVLKAVGWIMIFFGFGLLYPRKHYIIGPVMMVIGYLLAL